MGVAKSKGVGVGKGPLGEGVAEGLENWEGELQEEGEVEREIKGERDTEGEGLVDREKEEEGDTRGEREVVGEDRGVRVDEGDALEEPEAEEDGEGFQGVKVAEEEKEGGGVEEAVTLGERDDDWDTVDKGGLADDDKVTPGFVWERSGDGVKVGCRGVEEVETEVERESVVVMLEVEEGDGVGGK